MAAAGIQHSSLSTSAPFSGALLCYRTARALLHPLPADQGLLAERLPQPYTAVCTYCPKLAGIRFRRVEFFYFIKSLSGLSCQSGYEMLDMGVTVVLEEVDVAWLPGTCL